HPFVEESVLKDIEKEKKAGREMFAIDAIALLDGGLIGICDVIVGITAPAEQRIKRLMAREGITEEYARLRISAQHDDKFYREHCDTVLKNDSDVASFEKKCREYFNSIKKGKTMTREELFYEQKHTADIMDEAEKTACEDYCGKYKAFLNAARTEREAVKEGIRLAEEAGFHAYNRGEKLSPGDKIYKSVRGKALLLAIIGKKPMADGINIAAAHVDAPRLDLKQSPLYEDSDIALLKTHYYGGIRKYQWVTTQLELHGVVVKKNGEAVDVVIGRDENDPVLIITDLLPHLAADQNKKTLPEGITGENLNIVVGSIPDGEDKGKDRVKLAVLKILNEKYGITEEDFLSAELEAVPAAPVRDAGLDRSFIAGYGQDDRVCAFAEMRAIFDTEAPEKTAVCILADKEEIGSEGVSGMQSEAFECFISDLRASEGTDIYRCFENSFCISADVTNAFDPTYADVSDKRNNARVNYGVGISKFTGARGKSGSSDASAEVVGKIRKMFAEAKVAWQMGELGKVDQGGGGTVAMFMAKRNIDTIDAGVPVLSMHSPCEMVAKTDCYMTYKGMKALYKSV
ncbi:MAG: aminopeptidase, partial [Oscillospiraceae bacterium]|nr:aminopeptidase [Oscillospiraceae bacterium]